MGMLKCCLNPKVLAGLAAVGVGLYLVAPSLVLGALPLLIGLVCPLSMLLMMRGMGGMQAAPQGVAAGQYYCPMHPDVQAAQAGRCSKCGMDLVAAPAQAPAAEAPAGQPTPAVASVAPLGLTREEQVASLRAQLRDLDARQAELAAHVASLGPVEADGPTASPPSKALQEAERVALAAADGRTDAVPAAAGRDAAGPGGAPGR